MSKNLVAPGVISRLLGAVIAIYSNALAPYRGFLEGEWSFKGMMLAASVNGYLSSDMFSGLRLARGCTATELRKWQTGRLFVRAGEPEAAR